VQTTTNAWQGVLSAGATAEWRSEAAEAADGSPTLSAPSIPVFSGDVFVPYSHEVGQDVPGFFDELTRICLDAADNLQATAFTTGDGSAAPQGIVTGLAGTASEINGGGSEALDAADPYSLQSALPARFSANASWLSHIATANTFRQMETTNGAHEFPELRDTPPMLLGKRWYECSDMDGTIDAAATANNYALIYGDIREAFIIVDRVGATVSFIEQLFSTTNGRPSGQSGLFLQFRTGAEVVNIAAARLLDVPTTA
jgi:HK97 family phage major capsid protein